MIGCLFYLNLNNTDFILTSEVIGLTSCFSYRFTLLIKNSHKISLPDLGNKSSTSFLQPPIH